jgi:hypothetical protein
MLREFCVRIQSAVGLDRECECCVPAEHPDHLVDRGQCFRPHVCFSTIKGDGGLEAGHSLRQLDVLHAGDIGNGWVEAWEAPRTRPCETARVTAKLHNATARVTPRSSASQRRAAGSRMLSRVKRQTQATAAIDFGSRKVATTLSWSGSSQKPRRGVAIMIAACNPQAGLWLL